MVEVVWNLFGYPPIREDGAVVTCHWCDSELLHRVVVAMLEERKGVYVGASCHWHT